LWCHDVCNHGSWCQRGHASSARTLLGAIESLDLALPIERKRRMISAVPQASAVARMMFARHTCFCGALRSATIASSRRRSAGMTSPQASLWAQLAKRATTLTSAMRYFRIVLPCRPALNQRNVWLERQDHGLESRCQVPVHQGKEQEFGLTPPPTGEWTSNRRGSGHRVGRGDKVGGTL